MFHRIKFWLTWPQNRPEHVPPIRTVRILGSADAVSRIDIPSISKNGVALPWCEPRSLLSGLARSATAAANPSTSNPLTATNSRALGAVAPGKLARLNSHCGSTFSGFRFRTAVGAATTATASPDVQCAAEELTSPSFASSALRREAARHGCRRDSCADAGCARGVGAFERPGHTRV